MTAIVYYPAFEETEHLQQQIARACWYLSPIAPSSVRMQSSLEPDRFVPEGYTPEVERFASELPEWLSVRPDPVTLRDLEKADIVLLWKGTSALDALGSGIPQKLRKKGIMVFDVDHTDRMEGSRYIDISHRHPRNDAEIIANSKARFDELTREVAHLNDAYLFCSGPEVSRYTNFRYADGINIICNSVINDAELLAAAPPHVQIFGDPIFHFGCSQYAHEFRQKLTETHEQYGYRCIVPMKYFNLFTFWQPELAASTMAVPFDVKLDINLDLEANFLLHTTDNILTFLMLPVGCTLANNVYLLGCDGRPLNQNDYFWKHNEKTQFVGQMNNIQEVHPSFFKLDYDEYYLRHCDNVQAYVETGERAGKHFQMLTPSHIPALRAREHPFARADATQKLTVGLEPNAGNSQLTDALSEYGQASNTVVLGNTTADGRVAQPVFADGGSDEEMQWVADQMQRWIGPVAIRSNGIAPDNVDAVQRIFSPLSEDIQLKTMAPTVTSKQKTREPGQSSLSLQQSFDLADLAYDLAKHRLDVQNEERKVKSLTQLVGDQSQALSALGSKHEALLEEHRALLDGHRALLQELTATKKSLSEFRGQLSDIKNTHSTENALQQERTKNLKLEQKLDHTRLSDRVRILGERQAKVEEQQKAVQPAARHFAAMERFQSNEPDYQRFTRHLQKAELEQFSEEAKSVYGLDLTPPDPPGGKQVSRPPGDEHPCSTEPRHRTHEPEG